MFILLRNNYSFKKVINVLCLGLLSSGTFAQGLVNNGGSIVFTGSTQLYIYGSDGNYTSQSSGSITPSSSSTLTLEGNWVNNSTNVAFTADGGNVILAGATQTIGGLNPSAFYNLSLTGNGIKTLAVNSTTVGGQSTFTGILSVGSSTLDLNGNRIDITNSATGAMTRSSGYIISEITTAVNPSIIRWYHRTAGGSRIYPFGVNGSYIPFTFNITTTMTNTAGYVDVSTRSTSSDNTPWAGISDVAAVSHMYSPNVPYNDGSIPSVIDRWWSIENSDPITADMTFSYRGSENTIDPLYSTGFLGAQYWDGNSWRPDNAPIGSAAAVTSGIGTVTAPGISKFCPWVLSALLSPLPVELISFEANCMNSDFLIEWCTASENNNNNNTYFTLEQSIDNTNFQTIEKVYGTSLSKSCYTLATPSVSSDFNYFRLSQTDLGKEARVLKTISVKPCGNTNGLAIITNDGTKRIGVILNSENEQQLQLQIHNMLGQLVETRELWVIKGVNTISIDLTNVSNELYNVSVSRSSEKLISKKIVITDPDH